MLIIINFEARGARSKYEFLILFSKYISLEINYYYYYIIMYYHCKRKISLEICFAKKRGEKRFKKDTEDFSLVLLVPIVIFTTTFTRVSRGKLARHIKAFRGSV